MEQSDQRERKAKIFAGNDFCESRSKSSAKVLCLWAGELGSSLRQSSRVNLSAGTTCREDLLASHSPSPYTLRQLPVSVCLQARVLVSRETGPR